MMRPIRWLLPHPFLTILLALVWILLQNKLTAGMLVFGLILGIVIPILTARWWTDRPQGIRPLRMLAYILLVLWDIIVANVQVAWIILTKSNASMTPNWVVVPLDLKEPEAISILAGTITLTPGTVSADLSESGRYLLVHALDAEDPQAVCDDIKNRYERRLKEIFL